MKIVKVGLIYIFIFSLFQLVSIGFGADSDKDDEKSSSSSESDGYPDPTFKECKKLWAKNWYNGGTLDTEGTKNLLATIEEPVFPKQEGNTKSKNREECKKNLYNLYEPFLVKILVAYSKFTKCATLNGLTYDNHEDSPSDESYEPKAMQMTMMMGMGGGMGGMGMGGMGGMGGAGMGGVGMGGMSGPMLPQMGMNPMMMMMMAGNLSCKSTGGEVQDWFQCKKLLTTFDAIMMSQAGIQQAEQMAMQMKMQQAQADVIRAQGTDPTIQLRKMQEQMQMTATAAFGRASMELMKATALIGIAKTMPTKSSLKNKCEAKVRTLFGKNYHKDMFESKLTTVKDKLNDALIVCNDLPAPPPPAPDISKYNDPSLTEDEKKSSSNSTESTNSNSSSNSNGTTTSNSNSNSNTITDSSNSGSKDSSSNSSGIRYDKGNDSYSTNNPKDLKDGTYYIHGGREGGLDFTDFTVKGRAQFNNGN